MIETTRLLLRPYALDDFRPYHAMLQEPAVYRHLDAPMPEQDAWFRILRWAGHWHLLGYGLFAVLDRATGQFVGETGLGAFHRGLGSDFDGDDEAAWVFSGAVHGTGTALEAAQAAHDWYDANRGRDRTVCIIDPDNIASIRLAEKLGYRPYGEAAVKGRPVIKFQRLRAATG